MGEIKRKYSVRANYELKIQRFITMLKADEQRNIAELSELFEVSGRMVYNMVEEVERRGIKVDLNGGVPRLSCMNDPAQGGKVYLANDEAEMILYMIHRLSLGDPKRQSLSSMLGRELKQMLEPYFCHIDEDLSKVSHIRQALRMGLQLCLKNYRSGSSGTISDRIVEPVEWSANYRQLHAYDVEKRAMRTFVVSRMESVEVLRTKWQYTKEHKVPEIDCFWMSGEPYQVTLRMSLLALNLLHEEYPLSQRYKVHECEDEAYPYEVALEVRSPKGVGRFVKGLPEHVKEV